MRIVAGKYRSLKIEAVEGMTTRPTSDRIKEAVFSSIGPYFYGGRMLDCYGGSGNISLEAISRGIEEVDCFEIEAKAILCIQKNIKKMKEPLRLNLHKQDVMKGIYELNPAYDLIYIDPPYAHQQNEELLKVIDEKNLLSEEGVIVVESRKEDEFKEEIGQLVCFKKAVYGITKISYYERKSL